MATARKRELEAGNEYLGDETDLMLGLSPRGDTEHIDTEVSLEGAAYEKFMTDRLTIIVQSSGAENETRMVQVGVNGRMLILPRDEVVVIPRSYVEVLARAKRTDFEQTLDVSLGENMNRLHQHHSLKYPFTVVSDPDPRGHQWLRQILAQRR